MILQTKRLYLRNLQPEDLDAVYAYRNDPECAKYQRWEEPSRKEIARFLDRFRSCLFLSEEEEQHYAICLRDGSLTGDLSYFYTESDCCITLGITVAPQYQGQGIAREILSAVVSAIQNQHPHLDIVALIDPENEKSIRLFEALGFCRECYAESIRSCVYVINGAR